MYCRGGSLQFVPQVLAPSPRAVQLSGKKMVIAGYKETFGLCKSSQSLLLEFSHDALECMPGQQLGRVISGIEGRRPSWMGLERVKPFPQPGRVSSGIDSFFCRDSSPDACLPKLGSA